MLSRLRRIFAPAPADRHREFWRWFAANAEVVATLPQMPAAERDHTAGVLHDHLRRVDERLTFFTGRPADGAPAELIISADGRAEVFPVAEALVADAPELPGWQVIALKPAMPDVDVGIGDDIRVRASDLRFARHRAPDDAPDGYLGITVLYPREWAGEPHDYHLPIILLLEQYLGERAFAGAFDALLVGPDDGSVPADAIRPLAALAGLVAERQGRGAAGDA